MWYSYFWKFLGMNHCWNLQRVLIFWSSATLQQPHTGFYYHWNCCSLCLHFEHKSDVNLIFLGSILGCIAVGYMIFGENFVHHLNCDILLWFFFMVSSGFWKTYPVNIAPYVWSSEPVVQYYKRRHLSINFPWYGLSFINSSIQFLVQLMNLWSQILNMLFYCWSYRTSVSLSRTIIFFFFLFRFIHSPWGVQRRNIW